MALLYRMGTGNGGSDIQPYIVNFNCDSAFNNQELIMHYEGTPHAGETVEDVSGIIVNGTLTLYPLHDGVWSISVTSSGGNAFSDMITLEKWGTYNVSVSYMGYGDWLKAADIADTFGSLENVLADEKTVRELMTKHASADKLIQWYNANPSVFPLSTFTSSRIAMKWIGLRDYICDKMLAINALRIALINSTYKNYILFQSVNGIPIIEVEGAPSGYGRLLNESVPVMTDSDYSYGRPLANSEANGKVYKVFDRNETTYWGGNNGQDDCYVGYEFTHPVCIKKFAPFISGNAKRFTVTLVGRNADSDEWDILSESYLFNTNNTLHPMVEANKYVSYKQIAVKIHHPDGISNANFCWLKELNFYGVDYTEKEFDANREVLYIYDHGVEIESFETTSNVERTEDKLVATVNNSGNVIIGKKLNLSPYNSIRAIIPSVSPVSLWLGVADTLTGSSSGYRDITSADLPYFPYYNLSNENNNRYARIGKFSTNIKFEVTEFWLE